MKPLSHFSLSLSLSVSYSKSDCKCPLFPKQCANSDWTVRRVWFATCLKRRLMSWSGGGSGGGITHRPRTMLFWPSHAPVHHQYLYLPKVSTCEDHQVPDRSGVCTLLESHNHTQHTGPIIPVRVRGSNFLPVYFTAGRWKHVCPILLMSLSWDAFRFESSLKLQNSQGMSLFTGLP